jgi:hypothetical protein
LTSDAASLVEITLPSGARVLARAETPQQAGALAQATSRLVAAIETGETDECRLHAGPQAEGLPSLEVDAQLGGWLVLDTVLRSIESLIGRPLAATVSLGTGRAREERSWRQGWAARFGGPAVTGAGA